MGIEWGGRKPSPKTRITVRRKTIRHPSGVRKTWEQIKTQTEKYHREKGEG